MFYFSCLVSEVDNCFVFTLQIEYKKATLSSNYPYCFVNYSMKQGRLTTRLLLSDKVFNEIYLVPFQLEKKAKRSQM